MRHYVHIGTGNYHPKTARLYTDVGLFTCDEELGADVADMFNFLTGFARPGGYRKALVAPTHLRDGILDEIERTIAAHEAGERARIAMKMNSLVDRRCIRALYRASQAGVPVELNIRGICCLRPGVRGRLGDHPRRLRRRALPRALADLRLRARRRDPRAHRLGRPHAAQPRHPRRARRAGRGRRRCGTTCSTCSSARWPTTRTPGSSAPTAPGSAATPGDEPRSVQRELMIATPRGRPRRRRVADGRAAPIRPSLHNPAAMLSRKRFLAVAGTAAGALAAGCGGDDEEEREREAREAADREIVRFLLRSSDQERVLGPGRASATSWPRSGAGELAAQIARNERTHVEALERFARRLGGDEATAAAHRLRRGLRRGPGGGPAHGRDAREPRRPRRTSARSTASRTATCSRRCSPSTPSRGGRRRRSTRPPGGGSRSAPASSRARCPTARSPSR